ncbi:MAG: CDP-alcohol phosphatidyltransferase family protein [Acidobacteria bacterium]|nr:CDP-alcohol phosphatidyltransferase family protein [Acidobacteriota bacterium]
MRSWLTVPNVLTLCRLALAPFVIQALMNGRPRQALYLFAAAALTDGVDGYLARHFDWTSDAGAWLDPVADKVLLSGIFLALAYTGDAPIWFVALVFSRDLLILAAAGMAIFLTGRRKFPPSTWGKLSTFLQVVTVVAFVVRAAFPSPALDRLVSSLLWPAAAATIGSGMHYGWRGLQQLRNR